MKLYDSYGPNPTTVRLFVLERGGLELDAQTVDIVNLENRRLAYRKNVSARGELPALQLDDGQVITEITAICSYLDEVAKGGTSLFGQTPEERAVTRMWTRRVYLEICQPLVTWWRHGEDAADFYRGNRNPVPAAQAAEKLLTNQGLNRLDDELDGKSFICHGRLTMADIILYSFMSTMLQAVSWANPPGRTNVFAWYERMSARNASKAALTPLSGRVEL